MVVITKEVNKPPNVMLAIDPGESTGYCYFIKGKPAEHGIIRGQEKLNEWLQEQDLPIEQVVMEQFKLFSWKARQQAGSRMVTSQVEGAVLFWARMKEIPVDLQSPSEALPMGKIWSGVEMPRNHNNSHGISALYHGTYWLIKNGMKKL